MFLHMDFVFVFFRPWNAVIDSIFEVKYLGNEKTSRTQFCFFGFLHIRITHFETEQAAPRLNNTFGYAFEESFSVKSWKKVKIGTLDIRLNLAASIGRF